MPGGKRSTRALSPSGDPGSELVTSSVPDGEAPLTSVMKPVTSSVRQDHQSNHSRKDPLDAIQTLSLEEVQLPSKRDETKGKHSRFDPRSKRKPKSAVSVTDSTGTYSPAKATGGAIVNPQGADSDIIRSGHQELDTLYASNDCQIRGGLTVNLVNAPNNSTVQCGCENINCPFCNLLLSIEQMDPSVLQ